MKTGGTHETHGSGDPFALHARTPATLPDLPAITPPARFPPPEIEAPAGPRVRREPLRPGYVAGFRCIASACEDTCCSGWSVPLDRATYEKYESVAMVRPHLGTLIVLNPAGTTSGDFARIRLKEDSACPFLSSNRMCGIQEELGPEMLSATCATYPRAVRRNAGREEEALHLSCPEAARVTLLDEDLLRVSSEALSVAERYARVAREAEQFDGGHGEVEPRLAARELLLLLVGDRSYALWQRMVLLGSVAQQLQRLNGGAEEVAALLAGSARIAAEGRLRPVTEEMEVNLSEQLPLVLELLRLRLSQPPVGARFLACVHEFELGIGCATAKSEGEILERYREGYRRYYRPLMERHPHLLENYVTNYIFKNDYPFGRGAGGGEAEPLLLCVHLALVQTLLVGMAAHWREAFDCSHVVRLVQSLAKTIEHSTQFLDQAKAFVEERGLNHSRGIALLLRPGE